MTPQPATDSYEDRFTRGQRLVERMRRRLRWLHGGRNILVETRWRLGDEIMALPIYSALAAAFPGATIGAWCNYPDLLENHPRARPVSPDTFTPDRYVFLRSDPRNTFRLDHYARLAGIPSPPEYPSLNFREWLPRDVPLPQTPFIAVAPGASWPTKLWPRDRWQALVGALAHSGHHAVILGNEDEALGVGTDLAGKTTIRDAACILHHAVLAVTSDSGLMHLARAVDTPTVAIFGPTDPDVILRPTRRLTVLTNQRECAACWNRSQLMTSPGVCPKNIPVCLDTITVESVLAAIHRVLERP